MVVIDDRYRESNVSGYFPSEVETKREWQLVSVAKINTNPSTKTENLTMRGRDDLDVTSGNISNTLH